MVAPLGRSGYRSLAAEARALERFDDFPDVGSRGERGAPTGWSIAKDDAGVILDAHALVDEPFGGAGLGLTASASAELEALVRPLRGAYCSQGERVA
jgi:hypothetical protein